MLPKGVPVTFGVNVKGWKLFDASVSPFQKLRMKALVVADGVFDRVMFSPWMFEMTGVADAPVLVI